MYIIWMLNLQKKKTKDKYNRKDTIYSIWEGKRKRYIVQKGSNGRIKEKSGGIKKGKKEKKRY